MSYYILMSPTVLLKAVAVHPVRISDVVACGDVDAGQADPDCCGTFEIRDGAAVCNECGAKIRDGDDQR